MHELAAVQNILQIVLEEADRARAMRITRVVLKVGKWSTFVPGAIRFYFNILAEGTSAEGAHLDIDVIPISYRCRECNCIYEPCFESAQTPDTAKITEESSSAKCEQDGTHGFTLSTNGTSSLRTRNTCDSCFEIWGQYQEKTAGFQQVWRDSFLCPACRGTGKLLTGLEELYVDYIEVENADPHSSQDI